MGSILVAVDGTFSAREYNVNGNVSFVKRFHDSCNSSQKQYFAGPGEGPMGAGGVMGTDVDNIERRAWGWLTRALRYDQEPQISLIGHSRGGHIVVALARRLVQHRIGDFTPRMMAPGTVFINREPHYRIHFIGLYDAVDMSWNSGDTSTIPDRVTHYAHAVRSRRIGSRSSWGNTGMSNSNSSNHRTREFEATHGAVGGSPPHACEEGRLFGQCNVGLTEAENTRGGDQANQFILGRARAAGLEI